MTVRGYILIGALVVLALAGLRAWWWIDGLQRAASDAQAKVTSLEAKLASAQATIAQHKTTERVVTQYVDLALPSLERIVSILEGGYSLSSLARSVVAHIKTLADL